MGPHVRKIHNWCDLLRIGKVTDLIQCNLSYVIYGIIKLA